MDKLFNPKKLKHIAMKKIVSSHKCFNQINNNHLLQPKPLFKELVEIGPNLTEMPKYSLLIISFGFMILKHFIKACCMIKFIQNI